MAKKRTAQTPESIAEARLRALIRGVETSAPASTQMRDAIEAVLRVLFTEHARVMSRAAAPLDRTAESREDAIQDALTRFATRLQVPRFRRRLLDGRPLAFLLRMVRNRALDLRRAAQRRERTGRRLLIGPTTDPETSLLVRERRRTVRRLLSGLAPGERVLIDLFCLDGLSSRDVGNRLGLSAAVVRKRVSRTLERLRGTRERLERNE